jgi:hypothetical protein
LSVRTFGKILSTVVAAKLVQSIFLLSKFGSCPEPSPVFPGVSSAGFSPAGGVSTSDFLSAGVSTAAGAAGGVSTAAEFETTGTEFFSRKYLNHAPEVPSPYFPSTVKLRPYAVFAHSWKALTLSDIAA